MYVGTYVDTYIYIHTYKGMFICSYICIHVGKYMYICMYMCVCTYLWLHVQNVSSSYLLCKQFIVYCQRHQLAITAHRVML